MCSFALAADPPPSAEDEAWTVAGTLAKTPEPTEEVRELVDETLQGAESAGDLSEWVRSVIGDSLKRAGAVAGESADPGATDTPERAAAPLSAERHAPVAAAALSARPNSGEVLIFMSLAVPAPSWSQWAREAARTGAPLVLRGALPAGLRATVTEIGQRLDGHDAGVAIDPRLFRLFGVERVPAVVAVPGGVPACASRGCADDAPPPFDAVSGNIGLAAALETIAAEGDAGRAAALRHLERLGARP